MTGINKICGKLRVGFLCRCLLTLYNAEGRSYHVGGSKNSATKRGKNEMDGFVLVIDDEEPIREAICDILETVDIQCLLASNGESGIQTYVERSDEIRLVLLDLSMPGMSGEETLLRLVEADPAVRVVLSSGYSESEVAERIEPSIVCGFLQKPYQLRKLIEVVTEHIE